MMNRIKMNKIRAIHGEMPKRRPRPAHTPEDTTFTWADQPLIAEVLHCLSSWSSAARWDQLLLNDSRETCDDGHRGSPWSSPEPERIRLRGIRGSRGSTAAPDAALSASRQRQCRLCYSRPGFRSMTMLRGV